MRRRKSIRSVWLECWLTSVSAAKAPQPKSETLHLSRSTKPSRRQGVARSPSGQPAPVSLQISQPKSPLPRLLPLPGEKGGIGCGTEAPPCRITGNRADTPAGSAAQGKPGARSVEPEAQPSESASATRQTRWVARVTRSATRRSPTATRQPVCETRRAGSATRQP